MRAAGPPGLCSRYGSAVECPGEDHRSQDAARVLGKPSRCGTATASLVCNRLACEVETAVQRQRRYRNASFIANNRVVFNIKGNAYRLLVAMRYDRGIGFVRFIGTHAAYDRTDAETI